MPRAMKICAKPGCPAITAGSYCIEHTRERDKARGNSNQRGYGYAHQELRKAFVPEHKAGTLICWRCREVIPPDEPFDLGHDDDDRTIYRGPEHANHCNRAAAGRKSHNM